MKFKALFSICLAAGSFAAFAQTHVEGVEYFKADQLDNARELLERNMNNPGTDKAIANFYLGEIALENGDIAKAASYFEKGIAANPDYGYNYVGQGAVALKKGEIKLAENLFKQGEGKVKKDPAMQVEIARAYYYADPVAYAKQIEKRLEKARRINQMAPEVFIFEGDQLKDQKKWGEAGSKYEMAANNNPTGSDAYVKYANLFTQVNPDYAIKMLQQLLAQNPTSALGQRELANAYYNKKAYKEAAAEYGKYVKNPNHFKQDEDRYAFLLFYGQDFKGGYDYASQLLAANPRNFTAQRYQFMNAAQLKDMQDQLLPMAQALYEAHQKNPANKFAPIDYTLIADEFDRAAKPLAKDDPNRMKYLEESVSVLNEAMKDFPDNAQFNKQLSFVYIDENDFVKAADAYKGYLKKLEEPGYNDFVQQAIFSYFAGVDSKEKDMAVANANFDDAVSFADKALSIMENYKPVKIKGDVAKQRADKAEISSAAVPLYLESVALLEKASDPSRYASDAKDLYLYLGNYYYSKKEDAKAKEFFEKYLNYDPNNEDIRKFVEKL